ncbi:MAG: YbjN domain-containing protein [candidate division NC10 bacterium]|nr:YbjN domain-containing protein [candidate division NC10 bacterium]
MRTVLISALLVLGLVSPLLAQEKPAAPPDPAPASCRPFVSSEEAVATIAAYLERMKYPPVRDPQSEYPVLTATVKMPHATHSLRMVIDQSRKLVYVFLNRYLAVPKDHPNRSQVLQALMEQNWKLNLGGYQWDPEDGEVRFFYTFSTENGVGFEVFEAVVKTLLETGDRLWPELSNLARR